MAKKENEAVDPGMLIMQDVMNFGVQPQREENEDPLSETDDLPVEAKREKAVSRRKSAETASPAKPKSFPQVVSVSLRKDTAKRLKALKYVIACVGGKPITLSEFIESLIELYLPKLSKKESSLFKALLDVTE